VDIGEIEKLIKASEIAETAYGDSRPTRISATDQRIQRQITATLRLVPKLIAVKDAAKGVIDDCEVPFLADDDPVPDMEVEIDRRLLMKLKAALAALDAGEGVK